MYFIFVTGLIGCDKPDTLEACLGAAEKLIRSRPDGLYEVHVHNFILFRLYLKSSCCTSYL